MNYFLTAVIFFIEWGSGDASLYPYTLSLFLFSNVFSWRRLRTIAESQNRASRRMKDKRVLLYLASLERRDKSPTTNFGSLCFRSSRFVKMWERSSAILSMHTQLSLSTNPANAKRAEAVWYRSFDGMVQQVGTLLYFVLCNTNQGGEKNHR